MQDINQTVLNRFRIDDQKANVLNDVTSFYNTANYRLKSENNKKLYGKQ
jgi:hypothetical protein